MRKVVSPPSRGRGLLYYHKPLVCGRFSIMPRPTTIPLGHKPVDAAVEVEAVGSNEKDLDRTLFDLAALARIGYGGAWSSDHVFVTPTVEKGK